VRRAAWIIFGGALYVLAMSALGKLIRGRAPEAS
jgi:hypothetical protein